MNKRTFWEIFFGAALGIIIYCVSLEVVNLTETVEPGFLMEIMIIAALGFAGILLVRRISPKLFSTGEQ